MDLIGFIEMDEIGKGEPPWSLTDEGAPMLQLRDPPKNGRFRRCHKRLSFGKSSVDTDMAFEPEAPPRIFAEVLLSSGQKTSPFSSGRIARFTYPIFRFQVRMQKLRRVSLSCRRAT